MIIADLWTVINGRVPNSSEMLSVPSRPADTPCRGPLAQWLNMRYRASACQAPEARPACRGPVEVLGPTLDRGQRDRAKVSAVTGRIAIVAPRSILFAGTWLQSRKSYVRCPHRSVLDYFPFVYFYNMRTHFSHECGIVTCD